MMFHHTDQARNDMPLKNSFGLASHTPNHDLWETRLGGFSSGFTHFIDNMIRFEQKGSDNANPRAVPESDNYGFLPSTTTNFVNDTRSNKRSLKERDCMIERVEKKKLKTMVFDQSNDFFHLQGDSLVPEELSTPLKMVDSADRLVPGPDRSIAASNDAPSPSTYEESDSSAYLESQQWSEDRKPARRTLNYRRNRSSDKKRRDRINKKMRALEMLLPNRNKVDKSSVLDEAIEYVKSLQLQLQILSRGNHMFTSPMMMPQIPIPSLNQFSTAAAAMGLGMGMNFGHQFPISPMHGFPQMPCFPFLGGTLLRPSTSIDQVGSAPPMSGSNYSSYCNKFSQN